jgi:hypothetical protein
MIVLSFDVSTSSLLFCFVSLLMSSELKQMSNNSKNKTAEDIFFSSMVCTISHFKTWNFPFDFDKYLITQGFDPFLQ